MAIAELGGVSLYVLSEDRNPQRARIVAAIQNIDGKRSSTESDGL